MSLPFEIIDLTHTLHPKICGNTGIGGCGFDHEIVKDYEDFKDFDPQFRVQKLNMHAGIGTHIDAPRHCFKDGLDVASIPLENLIAPAFVIDISKKAHETYSLSVQDILDFENEHGRISQGSIVLIYTGWDKYWDNPTKYLNNFLFPSVFSEAAELLIERDISGLGIDTITPDRHGDGFPVHKILLGNGKFIIENATNLNKLPATGSYCFALPIKSQDGAEAPIRMIGLRLK